MLRFVLIIAVLGSCWTAAAAAGALPWRKARPPTPPNIMEVGLYVFQIITLAEETALVRVPEIIRAHSPRVRILDRITCYWILDLEYWPPVRKKQEVSVSVDLEHQQLLFMATTTHEIVVRIKCNRANREFREIKQLLGNVNVYEPPVLRGLRVNRSTPGLLTLETGMKSLFTLKKFLGSNIGNNDKTSVAKLKSEKSHFVIADTGAIFPLFFATIPTYENNIGKWGIITAPYQLYATQALVIKIKAPQPGCWKSFMTYGYVKARFKTQKQLYQCDICLHSRAVWYAVRNAVYAARRQPVLIDPTNLFKSGYFINNKTQTNPILPHKMFGEVYHGMLLRRLIGEPPGGVHKDRGGLPGMGGVRIEGDHDDNPKGCCDDDQGGNCACYRSTDKHDARKNAHRHTLKSDYHDTGKSDRQKKSQTLRRDMHKNGRDATLGNERQETLKSDVPDSVAKERQETLKVRRRTRRKKDPGDMIENDRHNVLENGHQANAESEHPDRLKWRFHDILESPYHETPRNNRDDTQKNERNDLLKSNQQEEERIDTVPPLKTGQSDTATSDRHGTLKSRRRHRAKPEKNSGGIMKNDHHNELESGHHDTVKNEYKDALESNQPEGRKSDHPPTLKTGQSDTATSHRRGILKRRRRAIPEKNSDGMMKNNHHNAPKNGHRDPVKGDPQNALSGGRPETAKNNYNHAPQNGFHDSVKSDPQGALSHGQQETAKSNHPDTSHSDLRRFRRQLGAKIKGILRRQVQGSNSLHRKVHFAA